MNGTAKLKNPAKRVGISQRDASIEAARKTGASEGEADFDRAIKTVTKANPEADKPQR
jgi:hypothetical protein